MSLEAKINGPILDEARKGRQRVKSAEEARSKVPGINQTLNALYDEHVLRDAAGKPVHDGRGWSHITVYLQPEDDGYQPYVNLIRHINSKRIDMWLEGLDVTMHVGENSIELITTETVPQRGTSSYESMHTPAGMSIPGAPPFQRREASLEELGYIEELAGILTDPSCVERIGNKLA